jgi:hypothetical protein
MLEQKLIRNSFIIIHFTANKVVRIVGVEDWNSFFDTKRLIAMNLSALI